MPENDESLSSVVAMSMREPASVVLSSDSAWTVWFRFAPLPSRLAAPVSSRRLSAPVALAPCGPSAVVSVIRLR